MGITNIKIELPAVVRALRWLLNTLFHQVVAVVAVYAIWFACVHYSTPFSWHVILCTLGYLPLMAEAIILFANDNVWSQETQRTTKYWIHGAILLLATVFIIVGTWCDTKLKIDWDLVHFETEHAITGLISIIFIIISLIFGFMAANTKALNRIARPVWFKFLHNLTGILAFIFGIVSLIYGYYEPWFKYWADPEMGGIYSATVATALLGLWTLYKAFGSLYSQGRSLVT